MIELMREFLALSEKMNYVSAALELNISQPTLSRHIAQLEKQLGFKLFNRNPLSLTTAGMLFLENASDIVERFDAAVEKSRRAARGEDLLLSICMITYSGNQDRDVIHEGIAELRKEEPLLAPRFYASKQQTVFEAVASGAADVGVLLAEPADLPEGFVCEKLMDIPFFAWLHEDNPIFDKEAVPFRAMEDFFMVHSTHRLFQTWFDGMVDACAMHGFKPKTHMKDIDDLEGFLLNLRPNEFVFGSGLAVSGVAAPNNPRVFQVPFKEPGLCYSVYLLYHESARPVVKRFVGLCQSIAANPSSV